MRSVTYSMNVSLDGYVDHMVFAPDAALFRHWTEHVRGRVKVREARAKLGEAPCQAWMRSRPRSRNWSWIS